MEPHTLCRQGKNLAPMWDRSTASFFRAPEPSTYCVGRLSHEGCRFGFHYCSVDSLVSLRTPTSGTHLGRTLGPKPSTLNPKPQTRNPKPETLNRVKSRVAGAGLLELEPAMLPPVSQMLLAKRLQLSFDFCIPAAVREGLGFRGLGV